MLLQHTFAKVPSLGRSTRHDHEHKELTMEKDEATTPQTSASGITRRDAIRLLGTALAVAPLASALGCADPEESGEPAEATDELSKTTRGGSHHPRVRGWAAGGTAAMTALASYPNPFRRVFDRTCTPTCAMMLGPCHDDQAPEREDVSEGQTGLPMRFGLRFLDEDCKPVRDADVDIWHCDVQGVYSSETNDTPSFCTGTDAAALASRWFRGHRRTDRQGVAWFNTCFPGWYMGRSIHIHFTVRRPNREGVEYLTSQIGFPASLIEELCASHPDYAAHGQPDTSNDADMIIPNEETYLADTQRMRDGALLASKTFILRNSLTTSVCSEGSLGGFPGDGGFPPGFPGDGGFPPGFPGAGGPPPGSPPDGGVPPAP
jgi:protocatechuate 3,4-dioxygenase beta subunit